MECDVIVTYCWNRVGYNIIKSLYRQGLKVVVGDTSAYNICSISKYSQDSFVYSDPFQKEEMFIADLLCAIEKYNPKMLIPTHDEGLIIAKHFSKFPPKLIIACESYDMQYKLSDKLSSTLLAQAAGVPVPQILKDLEKAEFPIVVKLKISNSAKGVFFPQNIKDAKTILDKYEETETLCQEFFVGTDYSVDCIRYDDFFVAATYKALVTKTDGGGTTTQRVVVAQPKIEHYAKQLLDYVNYKGVCGIDFKVNEDTGDVCFIEVNTRFTGGIATPIAAGFDIPYIVYSLFLKGYYEKKISIKKGVKTKWLLGDMIALITKISQRTLNKTELKRILSWDFDAFDDFSKEDPFAIWGEIGYYFAKLVKNRKLNP